MTRKSDNTNTVSFYPISPNEHQQSQQRGVNPKHLSYTCGGCCQSTNGRVLADFKRDMDGATVSLCVCTCPKEEPAILIERAGQIVSQYPEAQEFKTGENWPLELCQLYDEAAKAYAAGAYTAATMVARKVLMASACREGANDGKPFVDYVTYITDTVLTYPKAKDAIDKIRQIGNEANHSVRFVTREDAKRALSIVTYMLNAIYSLPAS